MFHLHYKLCCTYIKLLCMYSACISSSLNSQTGKYNTCISRVSSIGGGGQRGSFPPKNFMYINDVIQEIVSS